jgi:peptide/nickel transport system permease protein
MATDQVLVELPSAFEEIADEGLLEHRIRLFLQAPLAVTGLVILLVLVCLAAVGASVTRYDPLALDPKAILAPPTAEHWMGTDRFGRDVFSRVIDATRLDLGMAAAISLGAFFVGTLVGAIAGFMGGRMDQVIMRIVDALLAFPSFVLALAASAMLGNSVPNVALAVAAAFCPHFIRLTRGEMLRQRSALYADAARCVGSGPWRIMLVHLLPNSLGPSIVQGILTLSWGILTVSGLSFIGVGIRPPTAEWGVLMAQGAEHIVSGEWWTFVFPGLAIVLAVFGFNVVGDRLREVLTPSTLLQTP